MLKPLGDRVVIRVLEQEEKTARTIHSNITTLLLISTFISFFVSYATPKSSTSNTNVEKAGIGPDARVPYPIV